MTNYIFSKSSSFKDHLDAVLPNQLTHRSDLSQLKATGTDLVLIHADSYQDNVIHDALKSNPELIIAIADDLPDIGRMLRFTNMGVKGYCNAYMVKTHYQQLVMMLTQGQSWFPPSLLTQALSLAHASVRPEDSATELEGLTERQKQIALNIAEGKSNKEVAEACGISERTVKSHLTQIFSKLNVSDRLGLILHFKKLNLLGNFKRKLD